MPVLTPGRPVKSGCGDAEKTFMRLLRRARCDGDREDGFTLVEAVVALLIATIMFTGLAAVLISTLRAGVFARENQQAGDVVNRQLEYLRSLPFSSLTMATSDTTLNTASDPALTSTGGVLYFNPGTGTEKLAAFSVGAITAHMTTPAAVNGTKYTLSTYVTCPAESPTCVNGTGVQDRRLTIVAKWSSYGRTHTRQVSSIVTKTKRGLPLPYFKFGKAIKVDANIGGQIVVPTTLTNLGARDAWNLTLSSGTGWVWWWDKDSSGSVTTGDVKMTGSISYDFDANGVLDTGPVESGQSMAMVAVRDATAADVGAQQLTITATSAAQPTAPSASQNVTDTITTSPDYCPGCTSTRVFLHNAIPNSSNTSAVTFMPMDTSAPTQATLFNYSTDVNATTAGRTIKTTSSGDAEISLSKVAVWQRQLNNACSLPAGAYASVTLYGLPFTGTTGALQFFLGVDKNKQLNGFQTAGSAIYQSSTWATAFSPVTVSIPITTQVALAKNQYLEIRVIQPNGSFALTDMRVAYDTTTYQAQAKLPLSGTACL
jgi:Tfp pilus assembly protein PilV